MAGRAEQIIGFGHRDCLSMSRRIPHARTEENGRRICANVFMPYEIVFRLSMKDKESTWICPAV
jgi:hypothetical protein